MTGTMWLRRMLPVLATGLAATAAAETAPLLTAAAFRAPVACALDAFERLDAMQIERRLRAGCAAGPRTTWSAPRLDFGRSGSRAEARIGQALAWGDSALSLRLQVQAAARLAPVALSSRTELAVGLWWQPRSSWAMNLRVGGRRDDDGDIERRTTVTGAFQAAAGQLLITRWIQEDDSARQEIGWRWWLLPRQVSIDALVPARLAQDGAEARLSLSWRGFRL